MSGNEATHASVTAAALDRGRAVDAWSLALTAIALGTLLWRPGSAWRVGGLLACVLIGAVQKLLAARVAFDADLFRQWADAFAAPADAQRRAAALAAVDDALAALRLRRGSGQPRALGSRSRGALRLQAWQMLCLGAQFAALLAAAAH